MVKKDGNSEGEKKVDMSLGNKAAYVFTMQGSESPVDDAADFLNEVESGKADAEEMERVYHQMRAAQIQMGGDTVTNPEGATNWEDVVDEMDAMDLLEHMAEEYHGTVV